MGMVAGCNPCGIAAAPLGTRACNRGHVHVHAHVSWRLQPYGYPTSGIAFFKARAAEGAQEAAEKQARYLVITPMGGGGAGTLLSCHP